MAAQNATPQFSPDWVKCFGGQIKREKDGHDCSESRERCEIHVAAKFIFHEVTVMSITRNLDRTLLKVRCQAVGECVVFAEELEGNPSGLAMLFVNGW
jgi:hypothetical protein